jgi:hypothetical protein
MKPSPFTEEQIIGILREQEAGARSSRYFWSQILVYSLVRAYFDI